VTGQHRSGRATGPEPAPVPPPPPPPPPGAARREIITSEKLFDVLVKAGIADHETRRVVIDLRAGDLAVVYCEKYGTRSLIEVLEAMTSVVVRAAERDAEPPKDEPKGTEEP
jgi:hypothetical protein